MQLKSVFKKRDRSIKVSCRVDRHHHFHLSKEHDRSGFSYYLLENKSRKQIIAIRKNVFERFRQFLRHFNPENVRQKPAAVYYKNQLQYKVTVQQDLEGHLILQESEPFSGSTGFLSISEKSLEKLAQLFFHEDLFEPNDLLSRIVSYHRLFQFSFIDKQESMNSDLSLRKDVLSHVQPYIPRSSGSETQKKIVKNIKNDSSESFKAEKGVKAKAKAPDFETQLGAKSGSTPWEVNYDTLLQAKTMAGKPPVKKQENILDDAPVSWYPLSLTASTIKQFDGTPFECEFNPDESAHLRKNFLDESDSDYFLGFEMFHALFKKEKSIRSYSFPLYYLKVRLRQAHRMLYIEPLENGRFYLNHLALANLMESFSKSASKDVLPQFFKSLLSMNIESDGKMSRIYLSRTFPVQEEIFNKTREVFLGSPGEEGKGGILTDLKISGIECDVEDACLYKSKHHLSLLSGFLESDLSNILNQATENPDRFQKSLLGRFLSGGHDKKPLEQLSDKNIPAFMPGALPQSMKNLRSSIGKFDLLVLEGPPGTGKTHTIRNLLIDALCHGKTLVVVSDRSSAVEALEDKLSEFFESLCDNEGEKDQMARLWPSVIPTIYDIPDDSTDIKTLTSSVKSALRTDQDVIQISENDSTEELKAQIKKTDQLISDEKNKLQEVMNIQLGSGSQGVGGTAKRRGQPSSQKNIQDILDFLSFINRKQAHKQGQLKRSGTQVGEDFIRIRSTLREDPWKEFYRYLELPGKGQHWGADELKRALGLIAAAKPKSREELATILQDGSTDYLVMAFANLQDHLIPPESKGLKKLASDAEKLVRYPLKKSVKFLDDILKTHEQLCEIINQESGGVRKEFKVIHNYLDPLQEKAPFPVSLELIRFKVAQKNQFKDQSLKTAGMSPQKLLTQIEQLQDERDRLTGRLVIQTLNQLSKRLAKNRKNDQTPRKTRINFYLEQVAQSVETVAGSTGLRELQEILHDSYPVWICRKQLVPLLFPCSSASIDLMIVDESTQCRVDDAIPLLLRASKLMAVGDDRQTVLSKKSPTDDYLFREFNLKEHLSTTQATGIKGGGSHIFGLLKNINQASILLDEHYRCPPDIISYSNRYVYNSQLRIMQWTQPGQLPSVQVTHQEKSEKSSPKAVSGPFKGIETQMIDRFLLYMEEEIKRTEKQIGKKISLEKDVAICYFLLKNKAYFESIKSKFLTKLKRGSDILNGAGAELQGKERDYIFYFWDCQKSNFSVFKQGDDEHKRKGELNVLMSRPKKRAFHYLHKSFDLLAHDQASISDYLWNHLQSQSDSGQGDSLKKRVQEPGATHPINRGSGQLILAFISHLCQISEEGESDKLIKKQYRSAFSVEIGNPEHKTDLCLIPRKEASGKSALAVKDLSDFTLSPKVGEQVCDYYFQLKRANPKVTPVLCFLHDLIEQDGATMNSILTWFGKN